MIDALSGVRHVSINARRSPSGVRYIGPGGRGCPLRGVSTRSRYRRKKNYRRVGQKIFYRNNAFGGDFGASKIIFRPAGWVARSPARSQDTPSVAARRNGRRNDFLIDARRTEKMIDALSGVRHVSINARRRPRVSVTSVSVPARARVSVTWGIDAAPGMVGKKIIDARRSENILSSKQCFWR